jgi:hypothetical protein
MAITGSWGWTNDDPATHSLTPVLIDTVHDYTNVDKIGDKSVPTGTFALSNISTPNDGNEYIIYKVRDIPEVKLAAGVQHPARVKLGREINIRLEAVKRLKSDVDDSFIVDLPGEIDVTVRLPLNENVSDADAEILFARLVGATFESDDSGVSRFAKLLKGKVNPNT